MTSARHRRRRRALGDAPGVAPGRKLTDGSELARLAVAFALGAGAAVVATYAIVHRPDCPDPATPGVCPAPDTGLSTGSLAAAVATAVATSIASSVALALLWGRK